MLMIITEYLVYYSEASFQTELFGTVTVPFNQSVNTLNNFLCFQLRVSEEIKQITSVLGICRHSQHFSSFVKLFFEETMILLALWSYFPSPFTFQFG